MFLLAGTGRVEVEQNLLNNKVKTITAYYGNDLVLWGQSDAGSFQESHQSPTPIIDSSYAINSESQALLGDSTSLDKAASNIDVPDYLMSSTSAAETFG